MNLNKMSMWVAAAGVSLLVGCNLFNPNGAEESSCDSGNAECYITLGQSLIQQKSFTAAMSAYSTAIAIDSSKSEAYWGYATAATFKYNLELGSLLDDMQAASKNDPTAFMNHTDKVLTDRLQMAGAVVKVLGKLSDRDSLTRWYQYLTDTTAKHTDPEYATRKAFITAYLAAHPAGSRSEAQFPLTDRKKKFEANIFQYAPHLLLYTILKTYDVNGDGQFTDRDQIMRNLLSPKGGGALGDIIALGDSMETDPVLKQQVNDKILELQEGLGDLTEILAMFNISPSADTGGSAVQTKQQMDEAITSLGGSMVFYQFGDQLDNDGDGCIDEEIIDSLDNDNDGFVDEDARVIKGTGSSTSPGDLVNNDRSGGVDDIAENKLGNFSVGYPGSKASTLAFVAVYVKDHNETDSTSTWVMIKKGSQAIDTRIAIQNDSLAVHLTPGQPVPSQYQAKLDSAKNLVGGCWRKY